MSKEITHIENILPKHITKKWSKRSLSKITDITIHHSETPSNTLLESMARYHVRQHQWPGIAYHFAISKEGKLFQCNPINLLTYHNAFNNSKAVGIMFIGSYQEKDDLSSLMVEGLSFLIDEIKKQCPNLKYLMGHKEYRGDHTDCPGANICLFLDELRRLNNLEYNPKGNWRYVAQKKEKAPEI